MQCGRTGFDPWVGKIPWRRACQPTPVFMPGESLWSEELGGLQSTGSQSRTWLTESPRVHACTHYIGCQIFFCSLGTEVLAIAFHGCVSLFSNHLSVEVGEREARGLRNRGSGMLRTSLGMLMSLRIIAGMGWRGVWARDRNPQRNLGNRQFSELRKSGFTFKIGGSFAGRSGTDSLGASVWATFCH